MCSRKCTRKDFEGKQGKIDPFFRIYPLLNPWLSSGAGLAPEFVTSTCLTSIFTGMTTRNTNSTSERVRSPKYITTAHRAASIRPPTTAMPVQSECPMMPPSVTPKGSFVVASAIVAICDRSPHSARKVMVNDIVITLMVLRSQGCVG